MKTAAQRFSQLRSIPPIGVRSRRFSGEQVQCKKQQPSNGSFKAREIEAEGSSEMFGTESLLSASSPSRQKGRRKMTVVARVDGTAIIDGGGIT
jgi:hypothetical protein